MGLFLRFAFYPGLALENADGARSRRTPHLDYSTKTPVSVRRDGRPLLLTQESMHQALEVLDATFA
jgi:hypothetical protein